MKPLPERLTIPKTKRLTAPGKLIFFDTESAEFMETPSNIKHVLKLGHAILWERPRPKHKEKISEYAFTDAMTFWEWLDDHTNNKETVHLFAHNLTFDFLVLEGFEFLPCLGYTLQSIYSKFTTNIFRFANGQKRLVFVDTMNYFPVSLDKVAASVGMSKVDVDFATASDEELARHCRVDVAIIFEAVKRLIKETVLTGLAPFRLTASSLSSSIYRHSYMKDRIVVSHNPQVVEFEKSAYTGGYVGLCKLAQPGDPELYKLDVNSMYPSVMLENSFPTQMIEFAGRVDLGTVERFLRGYAVIARVDLATDEAVYPLKYSTWTAYPTGEFTTTLSSPMLKYAIERGHVKRVDWMGVYLQEPIFKDFVTAMYGKRMEARQEGDAAKEMFYKAINNTLYGKFGQRQTETKRVGDAPISEFTVFDACDPRSGEEWRELHAGGSVLFIYQRNEARYTSYAIAAHVTEYARAKLFTLRAEAGIDNVFYMDTDSLIVNREGYKRLEARIAAESIGALKIEDAGKFFVGFAKKDYIIGDRRKVKGFDVGTMPLEGNVVKSFQNVSVFGAARRDLRGGAFWREVNKYYAPYVVDCHIGNDGGILPISLPNEDYLLGHRRYTLAKVKDIVKHTFSTSMKRDLSQWLHV